MRQPVVLVMSGISVVVVGLSLRSGQDPHRSPVAAAPAGLVGAATSAPSPSPSARATVPAPRPASTRSAAHPVPTRPTAVATRAASAAPAPRPVVPRPAPRPTPTTVVVNGAAVDTQYGPVQVQIAIRGRRIVRADAIVYPQDTSRDQEINSQAVPQLDQETLQAQSARIDAVSGATYTSDGYQQSLQSALDAAHQAGAW